MCNEKSPDMDISFRGTPGNLMIFLLLKNQTVKCPAAEYGKHL